MKKETEDPHIDEIDFSPEGLGRLMFDSEEIQIILGSDDYGFEKQVLKGQLITQAEVRHMVVRQAKNGSSEAQKMIETWRMAIAMKNVM